MSLGRWPGGPTHCLGWGTTPLPPCIYPCIFGYKFVYKVLKQADWKSSWFKFNYSMLIFDMQYKMNCLSFLSLLVAKNKMIHFLSQMSFHFARLIVFSQFFSFNNLIFRLRMAWPDFSCLEKSVRQKSVETAIWRWLCKCIPHLDYSTAVFQTTTVPSLSNPFIFRVRIF